MVGCGKVKVGLFHLEIDTDKDIYGGEIIGLFHLKTMAGLILHFVPSLNNGWVWKSANVGLILFHLEMGTDKDIYGREIVGLFHL